MEQATRQRLHARLEDSGDVNVILQDFESASAARMNEWEVTVSSRRLVNSALPREGDIDSPAIQKRIWRSWRQSDGARVVRSTEADARCLLDWLALNDWLMVANVRVNDGVLLRATLSCNDSAVVLRVHSPSNTAIVLYWSGM